MTSGDAELVELLEEIRRLLRLPGNDFVWSPWQTAHEAIAEIDTLTAALAAGDGSAIDRLAVLFAPTGALQEVSIASGWTLEFLKLADRFDRITGTQQRS